MYASISHLIIVNEIVIYIFYNFFVRSKGCAGVL